MATVFLIDDDTEGCEFVAKFLERSGHTVQQSSCARSALAVLPVILPDVLVLDLHMPHMDGFTFLRELREERVGASLPVFVLTGDSDPDIHWRAAQLGVERVFLKGEFDPAELAACIDAAAAEESVAPQTPQHMFMADESSQPMSQSPA